MYWLWYKTRVVVSSITAFDARTLLNVHFHLKACYAYISIIKSLRYV